MRPLEIGMVVPNKLMPRGGQEGAGIECEVGYKRARARRMCMLREWKRKAA
jgi:hypothetical protein